MNVSRTQEDQEDEDVERRQQQQQQQQELPPPPSRASSVSSPLRLPPLSLVSTCEEMNPSRRSTFEDCSVYHPAGTWSAPDPNMAFVAVIDGHGGRDIVEYLETGLTYHISQELQQQQQQPQQDDNTDNNKSSTSNSTMEIPPNETRPTSCRAEDSGSSRSSSIAACLERAFLMADIHSKSLGVTSSGATVAVCLVTRGTAGQTTEGSRTTAEGEGSRTWTIHAANAGDARIVLSDQGRAVRMTHDHRTDDPTEVKRIEDSGGFVFKGRVLGVLAVTRSLGDHCMKEYVIAKPYTSQRTITMLPSCNDNDDEEADDAKHHSSFLIVGCDGLWDVMQDQDAVDFVIERLAEKELVAKFLVEEALKRGSTDNITVSVAFLT